MTGLNRASENFSKAQLELLEQINDMATAIENLGITGAPSTGRIALIKELSGELCSAVYIREKVDLLFGR